MLNITTGIEGHPEAVLLRGLEGISGPGRLTKALFIDRSLNRAYLTEEEGLWLEDDGMRPDFVALPRVGIGYANEEDRNKLWRFIVK